MEEKKLADKEESAMGGRASLKGREGFRVPE